MNIYRSEEKNTIIKNQNGRGGIGFEAIEDAIASGMILDILDHTNQKEYPGQSILIVCINDYARRVPCVKHKDGYFLKTMYPSRKATALYL